LIEARWTVFAPGIETAALFPEVAKRAGLERCKLQMMRIAPQPWRLPGVVMSDLSWCATAVSRHSDRPAKLRERLERECAEALAHGVHLIVAQSADGSLVVGDSHAYGDADDPFAAASVERLMMGELRARVALVSEEMVERWIGYYPVCDRAALIDEAVGPRARLVTVTSGTGMSHGLRDRGRTAWRRCSAEIMSAPPRPRAFCLGRALGDTHPPGRRRCSTSRAARDGTRGCWRHGLRGRSRRSRARPLRGPAGGCPPAESDIEGEAWPYRDAASTASWSPTTCTAPAAGPRRFARRQRWS
jgi:hypothetical protein